MIILTQRKFRKILFAFLCALLPYQSVLAENAVANSNEKNSGVYWSLTIFTMPLMAASTLSYKDAAGKEYILGNADSFRNNGISYGMGVGYTNSYLAFGAEYRNYTLKKYNHFMTYVSHMVGFAFSGYIWFEKNANFAMQLGIGLFMPVNNEFAIAGRLLGEKATFYENEDSYDVYQEPVDSRIFLLVEIPIGIRYWYGLAFFDIVYAPTLGLGYPRIGGANVRSGVTTVSLYESGEQVYFNHQIKGSVGICFDIK